jgi:hypothetical protein
MLALFAATSWRKSFAKVSARWRIWVGELASLEVAVSIAEIRSNALEISAFRSIAVFVVGSIDASRMAFRQAS